MRFAFLSDAWFARVDELVAAAGDLQVPEAMRIEVNVTITAETGDTHLFMKDGMFTRGHQATAVASVFLPTELARRIFVGGDVGAGVSGFLEGEMRVEGDLAKIVAMQTMEPSRPQQALTRKIQEITS